jgi:two-component system NtrC family response regulator
MTPSWTLHTSDGLRFPLERKLSLLGSATSCDLRLADAAATELQLLSLPDRVVAEPQTKGLRIHGAPAPAGIPVDLREGSEIRLSTGAILLLRGKEPTNLPVEPVLDAIDALLDAEDPTSVLPRLLEFAARHLDADGGVLLQGEGFEETVSIWPASGGTRPSRSAVQAALSRGRAVLWSESGDDQAPLEGPSLRSSDIRSILCSPIRSADDTTPLGCLYLHRTGRPDPFKEPDRQAFERLLTSLARVLSTIRRGLEDHKALKMLSAESSPGLLAFSPNVQAVILQARRFASASVPMLVLGETGTGKERLARLIHASSPRAKGPFVAINCAAIPESLMESELFGHEKGAFTGAGSERAGLFEAAGGGTLFLDEMGELAPQLQAALLRALQEKTIRRVGSSREIPIDVRIVAATHRDLDAMVREGKFRQDLLFRLNVATVKLPPLRERPEDVLPMARVFAQRASAEFSIPFAGLSRAAEKSLLRHSWTGNVRELENCLQRALLLAAGERVQPEHLGLPEGTAPLGTLAEAREAAERAAVEAAMARSAGNLTQAGAILGIDRKVLRDLLRKLGMYAGPDADI